ncbi:hypothetical protein HKD37_11G031640 [Glycine soja]
MCMVFATRDDILQWARSVAHENGFVEVIMRYDTNTGVISIGLGRKILLEEILGVGNTHTDQVDPYNSYGSNLITNTDHLDPYDNTKPETKRQPLTGRRSLPRRWNSPLNVGPQCRQPTEEKKLGLLTKKKLQRQREEGRRRCSYGTRE